MNHKFSFLSVTKPISQTPSLTDVEQGHLRDGFKLPQSYREVAVRFGFGLTCDFFYLFMPQGGCDDLANRSRDLHEVLLDGVIGAYKDCTKYEPHGSPDLLTNLVPFGIGKNGNILTWSPEERSQPDEL